jgi:hypothetical protein
MRSLPRQESEWIQALVCDVKRLVERHWLRRHPRTRSLVDEPPVAEADDPGLVRDISNPAQGPKRTRRRVGGRLRRGPAQAWAGGREAGRRLGRWRRPRRTRAVRPLTVEVASALSRAGDRLRHRAAKGTAVDARPKRRERGERDSGEQHESGPLDRRLSMLPCHPATVWVGGAPVGAVCDISVRGALLLPTAQCSPRGACGRDPAARRGPSPAEAGADGSPRAAAGPAASGAVRLGAGPPAGWARARPPAWPRCRAPGRGRDRRGRPGGAPGLRGPRRPPRPLPLRYRASSTTSPRSVLIRAASITSRPAIASSSGTGGGAPSRIAFTIPS